jgi:hypothetical protein
LAINIGLTEFVTYKFLCLCDEKNDAIKDQYDKELVQRICCKAIGSIVSHRLGERAFCCMMEGIDAVTTKKPIMRLFENQQMRLHKFVERECRLYDVMQYKKDINFDAKEFIEREQEIQKQMAQDERVFFLVLFTKLTIDGQNDFRRYFFSISQMEYDVNNGIEDTDVLELAEIIRNWIEGNTEALQHITSLDLRGLELKNLSPAIKHVTQLVELYINNNEIAEITCDVMESLPELLVLGASNNQLESLSPKIGLLTKLISLNVSGNKLTNIPPEIKGCVHLVNARLDNNPLEWLPVEFDSLPLLDGFSRNRVKNVPRICVHSHPNKKSWRVVFKVVSKMRSCFFCK